jgi:hypothetical protein
MYDVVGESKTTPFLEADLVPPSSPLMVRRHRRVLLQVLFSEVSAVERDVAWRIILR